MEILLSFGPFKVYTLPVFVILAFLWAVFVVSRRAEEYHLDRGQVFDLSVVAFVLGALSFKVMGLMWGEGFGFWYFMFGMILGVVSFSLWKRLKVFEVLDIVSPGALMGIGVVFLGLFASAGNWVNLVNAIWYFVFFIVCFRVEYKYRFWGWYKGGRSESREGLNFGLLLMILGLGRVVFETWIGVGVFILGLAVIYIRSGRELKIDFFRVLRK